MSRLTATDRLRRLLSVIPWVSGRGEVALSEIAARFDYPIDRLRRDLTEVVQFVGVYPHTPDMLIEVYLDEENERVRFELADYFTAPLRLTPEEALSLVSAGLGLLGSSVGDDTALERALQRIAKRFDVDLGDDIDVSLGGASPATVEQAMSAAEKRHCLEIDYYSLHRGHTSTRVVEPHNVFSRDGEWYLRAYCRTADGERTFRLDRVLGMRVLDETFEASSSGSTATFAPSEDDLRVTLELSRDAAWVAEAFPVESSEAMADGLRVTMVASSRIWLERLLVQLGPAAKLVESDPELASDVAAEAAERILSRYRDG